MRALMSGFLAALLFASFAAAGTLTEYTLTHQGVERNYTVYEPPGLRPGTKAPAVMLLHGGGGTGAGTIIYTGLHRWADREGFVILAPETQDGRWWNTGRTLGVTQWDDLGFLREVAARGVTAHRVHRDKLHLVGLSSGGYMAQHTACQGAFRLRGLAVAIAMTQSDTASTCQLPRPLPVLMVFGSDDPFETFPGAPNYLLSRQASVDHWAQANGCRTAVVAPVGDDVSREVRGSCRNGVTVEALTVTGMGHQWPGSAFDLPDPPFGAPSDALDATAEVVRFLGL